MNRYFVVMPDGQRYGPATLPHLADWVREGRVLPDTVLEEAQTGQRLYASQISGLPFGLQGQFQSQPPSNLGPGQGPYAAPGTTPYSSGQPGSYGQPYPDPYSQVQGQPSPYGATQYVDYGRQPSSGLSVVAFVLSLLAALTCFGPVGTVLAVVALILAVVARSKNDRAAGCAMAVSIVTLALTVLFALGRQMLVGG